MSGNCGKRWICRIAWLSVSAVVMSVVVPLVVGGQLHAAAERCNLTAVRVTLALFPKLVHAHDFRPRDTLLHAAAQSGCTELVAMLLERGADPSATNIAGRQPMHLAAGNGRREVVRMLLDASADVNSSDQYGRTPLHMTCAVRGYSEIVSSLLAAGADPNARDKNGVSPLHLAVNGAEMDVAELLLAAGADANATTTDGDTPLKAAKAATDEQMMELLREYGAHD